MKLRERLYDFICQIEKEADAIEEYGDWENKETTELNRKEMNILRVISYRLRHVLDPMQKKRDQEAARKEQEQLASGEIPF